MTSPYSTPLQQLHSLDRSSPNLHDQLSDAHLPNSPTWKRLISGTLAADERISLITTIFSDDDEGKKVRNVSGDDAQAFIDMIDEVSLCTLSPPKSWLPLKLPRPVG